MILRHVYLNLNLTEYPDDLTTPFGFQTRYVCNFIERRLKALRFKVDGFSKICIQGRQDPSPECSIVPENALVPEVRFDREKYAELSVNECHEFFLAMLESGFSKCSPSYSIPLEELSAALSEFRQGSYINRWVHQKKRLKPYDLDGVLECELNRDEFRLSLSVFPRRGGDALLKECILRTKPDEIIFQHQFKEMKVSGDDLVVLDKFGKVLYRASLADLD